MVNDYLSIGAVERDSGIARDTLRVWERRYGFPEPLRNPRGERLYPVEQLRKLQKIRRLMDQGHRPGKIVALSDADLLQLENTLPGIDEPAEHVQQLVTLLQDTDGSGLEDAFDTIYKEHGMEYFIVHTAAPMLRYIGELWARNQLDIYEEHFLSVTLTRFLNNKISILQRYAGRPRALLATLPGERHTLGLLMVASMLSSHGISVINLGAEVPLDQLVSATDRYDADIVGITFSGAYPYENIRGNLTELRDYIEQDVDIWVGGDGVTRLRKLPAGVTRLTSLDKLPV
jgi:DNA-binding transcriptional MerR regulator